MTDASTFYAIDLDHTLLDTTRYRLEYAAVPPENRSTDLSSLIYDEGKRLLAELTARRLPFGIITFGEPDEQRLKLDLTGLGNLPYMLSDTPEKAAVMGKWKQDDGLFHIPPAFYDATFREIVLVDDKAAAFNNLPDGIRSYLYRPTGVAVLGFQAGDVPDSVTTISDLLAILP